MYQDTRNNRYLNDKQRSKSYKVLQVLEDLRSDLRSSGGIPASGEGPLVTSVACSTSAVDGTRFFSAGMAESSRSPSSSWFALPGTSCRLRSWSTCLWVNRRPPPPSSLYALYESGPVLLSMCAFFHLGPAAKFLTRTLPPLQIVSLSLCCHATSSVTIVGFARAVWCPVEWDPVAFARGGWTATLPV